MYDFPALKYVLWLIYLIPVVLLVRVYRGRQYDEPALGFKMAGYYVLGCFMLRLNDFAIPLGFIVYLVFFRPVLNALVKKKAALLGLLTFGIMLVYILLPDTRRVERVVEVPATGDNAYSIGWEQEQQQIASRLPQHTLLNDFSFSFQPDGTIRELRQSWISPQGTYYDVRLNVDAQKYAIRHADVYPKDPAKPPNKPPVISNGQIPVDMLVAGLDRLRLQEMLPDGKFDYYAVIVPSGMSRGKVKGLKDPSYIVRGSEQTVLKEGEEMELPYYYNLFVQGMMIQPPRKTDNGSGTVISHSSVASKRYYIVPKYEIRR